MDRQRTWQRHGLLTAACHRLFDPFRCPRGILQQQVGGEIAGPLDADAAAAEIALGTVEQLLGRGVVQVDAEAVREHELDASQRVVRTGILAEVVGQVACADRAPVDTGRVDLALVRTPALQHPDAVLCERVRIALQAWQDVFAGDGRRQVPGGAENQVGHAAAEHRGLAKRLADDDAHRHHHLVLLDQFEAEVGDVHAQVARLRCPRQPAKPLHVDLDLGDQVSHRTVEHRSRPATKDAVRLEPVARLEAQQCGVDQSIEAGVVEIGAFRQVAGVTQATAD